MYLKFTHSFGFVFVSVCFYLTVASRRMHNDEILSVLGISNENVSDSCSVCSDNIITDSKVSESKSISKHLSDNFPIQNGLKRGDALSPLLFNIALEYASRKVWDNQIGLKLTLSSCRVQKIFHSQVVKGF
jgi:hypothetical protein